MTNKKFPPEDQNTDPKHWTSDDELARAQSVTQQPESAHKSEEKLKELYPTEFGPSESIDDLILSHANSPDAEKEVEELAGNSFDKPNPVDKEGCQNQLEVNKAQITADDRKIEGIKKAAADKPTTENVPVDEPKYSNVKKAVGTKLLLGNGVFAGFAVVGATISNLLAESSASEWLYEYPLAAYLFAFIPIGMSLVLAQVYDWIDCKRCKNTYLAFLVILCALASVARLLTLGPAYADQSDNTDISAVTGFAIYPVHLTIQLLDEILIGALFKIGFMRVDQRYRKTEARETEESKASRLAIEILTANSAPLRAENRAIALHLTAHAAARQKFINECLAFLKSVQAEQALAEARADAIAQSAKLEHLSLVKNTD